MDDVKQQFAIGFRALQAWTPVTPADTARRAQLLKAGQVIGSGTAAIMSAQTWLVPMLTKLTGSTALDTSLSVGHGGASGLMQLWLLGAGRLMQAQGLGALDMTLALFPALLIGVGVVLLYMGARHDNK